MKAKMNSPATTARRPARALHQVGLIYASDAELGFRRKRVRNEFIYLLPSGARLRDQCVLERIRRLAVPPAYTEVWICSHANGHLQATGRDARGRKQYRYHAHWRAVRNASKYHRMVAFAEHLPALRTQVATDLRRAGLPRRKVLAALVRLLETSLIRVGNEEYSRTNGSFGLTTLKNSHVRVRGERMQFRFNGKSGQFHNILLDDARLARILRRCQELPGQALFQFLDADGKPENIDSSDVNAYIREFTAADFSAKDFRTWAGTLLTAQALSEMHPPGTAAEAKACISAAIAEVARRLGNTPNVCRACYVHPAVPEAFTSGLLKVPRAPQESAPLSKRGLSSQERALKRLLVHYERSSRATPPRATR
jgi:DNA topoisomerase-1